MYYFETHVIKFPTVSAFSDINPAIFKMSLTVTSDKL